MTRKARATTPWDFLTLALWSMFFAAGLVPQPVFFALRRLASVSPQHAMVNSSAVITVAFALYLGYFARQKCREAGLNAADSQARGVQVALLGLVAFLEVPNGGGADGRTFLEFMVRYNEIADTYVRYVVLGVGAVKLMTWWYLFSLVLRFHAFGVRDVFVRMVPLLPSASGSAAANTPGQQQSVSDSPGTLEPPAALDEWRSEDKPSA